MTRWPLLQQRKFWLLLALLLPLVVLSGNILRHQLSFHGAGEWRIPVRGWDPRDLLRGQYLRFAYDWDLQGDVTACRSASCELCLSQEADRIIATVRTGGALCPARVDVAASDIRLIGRWPGRALQFTSRIFVSEKSAPRLEAEMRDHDMCVVALLDRHGRLVNRRMEVC